MKSPLQLYEEIAKEFGITDEKSLHTRQKIAWFEEQANQQRMVVNRLLGDLAKARMDLESAKDDVSKNAYRKKANDFENDLSQMTGSLGFFIEIVSELKKENPGVETKPEDIPESD